ncbi:MAG: hypothetical protein ABW023_02770 [Sphingomonas sp.]
MASPAAAQSLEETHERVWMPSGKATMLVWRMRDRAEGTAANHHHQAGKGQMPVAVRAVAKGREGSVRRAENGAAGGN